MLTKTICVLAGLTAGVTASAVYHKTKKKKYYTAPASPTAGTDSRKLRISCQRDWELKDLTGKHGYGQDSNTIIIGKSDPNRCHGYIIPNMLWRARNPNADREKNILCKEPVPIRKDMEINSNVMVVGGSGSGKDRSCLIPNLLQMDTSYIIADPGGDLLRDYGRVLEYKGYRIKCLDLIHTDQSNCYNPLAHLRSHEDIRDLVRIITANPESETWGDDESQYREIAETALLNGILGYLYQYTAPEEQHLYNVIRMLRAEVESDHAPEKKTILDVMFEEPGPDNPCAKQYESFKSFAGYRNRRAVAQSCIEHLQFLESDEMVRLTSADDIDLDSIGEEKTALFIVVPKSDTTRNMLAVMLQWQAMNALQKYAEHDAPGVRLVVDAAGNIVKTFRSCSGSDNREEAESYFIRAKNGQICYNKDLSLWILESSAGEPVLWRGSEKEAEIAFEMLKNGKVLSHDEYRTREHYLPVPTRFFFNEFANIGRVPYLTDILYKTAKYGISFFFVLQSLSQLERMYPRGWNDIRSFCHIMLYLGPQSNPMFLQNDFIIPDNTPGLRALRDNECLVLVRPTEYFIPGINRGYYCSKYDASSHPMWSLKEGFAPYRFDPVREQALADTRGQTRETGQRED